MKFSFNKNTLFEIADKYFMYLALFFVLIIVGLGINYFVLPIWRDVRSVDAVKVQAQQKELDDLNSYIVELKRMRDQYATVDFSDIKRLEAVLPRSFDKQKIYLQIQDFVAQSDLSLTSLNIAAANESAGTGQASRRATNTSTTNTAATQEASSRVQAVTIEVGVNGIDTYQKFKHFMTLIEQEAPLLNLKSVTYPVSGASVNFSLQSYYLSE